MGSRTTRLGLAALAVLALAASAASAAGLRVAVLHSPNRTDSNRTAATIDRIVIHVTEGRYLGSVRWLDNARANGSAHFVVSKQGDVAQLVSVTDVAWHSGNNWWNLHSIGIEHEGRTARGGFTEAEYRASAELVAYLSHRYGIPLDRRHIIGHNEVPDPYHPWLRGGVDHHQDPGRHWKWAHYMALIHYYAKHPVTLAHVHRLTIRPATPTLPAVQSGLGNFARTHIAPQPPPTLEHFAPQPKPQRIEQKKRVVAAKPAPKPAPRPSPKPRPRSVVDRTATVHGSALWWSGVTRQRKWRRHIYRVDFLVDGRVLYTDHTWPFSFHRHEGWDTRAVANGRHMLVVRAFGTHHYRARKSIPVRVDNAGIQLDVVGATAGSPLAGQARIGVTANEPLDRVALYVDGRPVSRDGSNPYDLLWNTRLDSEGSHEIVVYARGRGGRRAAQRFEVVVANAKDFPQALTREWATTTS